MFRVHTPIIRSIRCWVAAYGFLHRVFWWVVVLRAAAWVVCTVRIVPCGTIRTVHTTFHFISWGSCTVKQSSNFVIVWRVPLSSCSNRVRCNNLQLWSFLYADTKLHEIIWYKMQVTSLSREIERVSYGVHSAFIYGLFHATYCPPPPSYRCIVTSKPNGIFKWFLVLV